MPAPSQISAAQRMEAESRIYAGESFKHIALVTGIAESTIRHWANRDGGAIKEITRELVNVENKVRGLNPHAQLRVRTQAEEMLYMSRCLAQAGAHGAEVAQKMNKRAAKKAVRVEEAETDHESEAALRQVAALLKTASIAAEIPLSLIRTTEKFAEQTRAAELENAKDADPGVKDLSDTELAARAKDYGIDV